MEHRIWSLEAKKTRNRCPTCQTGLADSQIGQAGFPMLAGRPSCWASTKPAKAGLGSGQAGFPGLHRTDLFPNQFWIYFWRKEHVDYELGIFYWDKTTSFIYIRGSRPIERSNIQSTLFHLLHIFAIFPISCYSLHHSMTSSSVLGDLADTKTTFGVSASTDRSS